VGGGIVIQITPQLRILVAREPADRCSTSGRNPVRLASGIVFDFVGIAIWPLEVRWESVQSPQPPLIDCQDKTTTSGAIQKRCFEITRQGEFWMVCL
jgi:hypothetical protein